MANLARAQEHLLTWRPGLTTVQPKPPTYPILLISFQGPTQEFQGHILILVQPL